MSADEVSRRERRCFHTPAQRAYLQSQGRDLKQLLYKWHRAPCTQRTCPSSAQQPETRWSCRKAPACICLGLAPGSPCPAAGNGPTRRSANPVKCCSSTCSLIFGNGRILYCSLSYGCAGNILSAAG